MVHEVMKLAVRMKLYVPMVMNRQEASGWEQSAVKGIENDSRIGHSNIIKQLF